ncbi:MAG: CPBP family intramembrane metalloprotease [Deltaproteobacteria bacterium]|nr:CPBP family intramembrane metalloprotease [Deltaproteobacteria bacterium]
MRHRLGQLLAWAAPLRETDRRTVVILTAAALILVVFKKVGGPGFFRGLGTPLESHPRIEVIADLWWFGCCFLMLGVVPALITSRLRGVDRAELGLGIGDHRFGLRWVAILYGVMLPVIGVASRFESFWRYYPLNEALGREAVTFFGSGQPADWIAWLVLYEVGYALYFVGWEYFYRGFLTISLYRPLGIHAIFVGNIPFVLMHAGKPFPEALGSIVAGVALGLFALRARSFWYGWLLHALIAASMDLLAIQQRIAAG